LLAGKHRCDRVTMDRKAQFVEMIRHTFNPERRPRELAEVHTPHQALIHPARAAARWPHTSLRAAGGMERVKVKEDGAMDWMARAFERKIHAVESRASTLRVPPVSQCVERMARSRPRVSCVGVVALRLHVMIPRAPLPRAPHHVVNSFAVRAHVSSLPFVLILLPSNHAHLDPCATQHAAVDAEGAAADTRRGVRAVCARDCGVP
jgi:hypothetical protein